MQIEVNSLKPNMILKEDIIGKSGKIMMKRGTSLTELQIEFLKKFLIKKVTIKGTINVGEKEKRKKLIYEEDKENSEYFLNRVNKTIIEFKKMFNSWQNNIPINMYDIREFYIPLFEYIEEVDFNTICRLHQPPIKRDYLYYKSTAIALLSVYLAKQLNYEKKEWIQIGFGGLLSDSGLANVNQSILKEENELTYDELREFKKHPIYSYKLLEKITTLKQSVKIAVLQHHEKLDGSGYPGGLKDKKIHIYAKIIGVADFFYSSFKPETMLIQDIIDLLNKESDRTLDKRVVNVLKSCLKLL